MSWRGVMGGAWGRDRRALLCLVVLVASLRAADAHDRIDFNIPSQPLPAALDAYVVVTGLQVFYDSDISQGLRSTAVRGWLAPDVALRVILEGTNLRVLKTANAFSIAPSSARRVVPAQQAFLPYLASLQRTLEGAFCGSNEARPGDYRAVLRFRIGTSGEILGARLLVSTGARGRDEAIEHLLDGLRLDHAPPPALPQPITMIVAPRPISETGDCAPGLAP